MGSEELVKGIASALTELVGQGVIEARCRHSSTRARVSRQKPVTLRKVEQ